MHGATGPSSDAAPARPAGEQPARLPSWHARSGRLTTRKRWALDELADRFADLAAPPAVGRFAAVAVEIGAGTGEAALELARRRPDWLVVATEVHKASLATLLLGVHDGGFGNVAVLGADGRDVLVSVARSRPIDLVRVFFPDPWPKHRHRARRLVEPGLADLLADVLATDGSVELATDDARYAVRARRLIDADERFTVIGTDRAQRPLTYYERRALDEGRTVHDLRFGLAPPAPGPEPAPPTGGTP